MNCQKHTAVVSCEWRPEMVICMFHGSFNCCVTTTRYPIWMSDGRDFACAGNKWVLIDP